MNTLEIVISIGIALFIIIDPFLSMAVFIKLMQKAKPDQIRKNATLAVSVCFMLLLVFLFIGTSLLNMLGVDMGSFRIAGGIILLLMGIEQVLGLEYKRTHESIRTAAVVIGTPLLAGPGALSTIIIFSSQYGIWLPMIALVGVCAITWLMLYYSSEIQRVISQRYIEVASKVLGLLLAAIAITYIKEGVRQILAIV